MNIPNPKSISPKAKLVRESHNSNLTIISETREWDYESPLLQTRLDRILKFHLASLRRIIPLTKPHEDWTKLSFAYKKSLNYYQYITWINHGWFAKLLSPAKKISNDSWTRVKKVGKWKNKANRATKAVINSHKSQQTRAKLRNVGLIASPALFGDVDQPKRKN